MTKNKKKLIKEILKRKYFLKKELKKKILKSIIQNKQINQSTRMFASLFFQEKIAKNNKICLLTSKYRGVETSFFFSRHTIKKLSNINELQNLKVKSW